MNSDWTKISLIGNFHSFQEYEETKIYKKKVRCDKHNDFCLDECNTYYDLGIHSKIIKFNIDDDVYNINIYDDPKCCEKIKCSIDIALFDNIKINNMYIRCGENNYLDKDNMCSEYFSQEEKDSNGCTLGYNDECYDGELFFVFDNTYNIKITNCGGEYYPHMVELTKNQSVLLKTFI